MFDLEKFKLYKYYVHLPNREYFYEVMEYLNKNNIKWINGDSLKDDVDSAWNMNMSDTCIIYDEEEYFDEHLEGVVVGSLSYFKENGYKRLEINKVLKGDINMNEKIKRDLIKMLFEKEFYSHEIDRLREYKGRIIFDYFHKGAKFIDFIDKLNEEYKIKGHEVAEIIIEEFDLKEYKEEE